MDRASQLLCLFAYRLPKSGLSQLGHFVYLADYQSRRYLAAPLTDSAYHFSRSGPADYTLQLKVLELVDGEYLVATPVVLADGVQTNFYDRGHRPADVNLSPAETAIVESIIELMSRPESLNVLSELVRATEPAMKAIADHQFGEPLEMSIVDGLDRIDGMELEDVLRADADLQAGQGVPLAERTRA